MPITKKYTKKRRTYKRKKPVKKGTQSTAIAKVSYSSGTAILAPKYVGKLNWLKTYNIAAGTSDVVNWMNFNVTSMWDPESWQIASSLQPYGHDQLGNFYNHYKVIKAKVTYDYMHTSGNPMVIIALNTADQTYTNFTLKEQAMIHPQSTVRYVSNETPRARIVKYYNINTEFDKAKQDLLVHDFVGTVVPENYYTHFGTCNHGPGATQAGGTCTVSIEYTIVAFERKVIAQS